MEPFGIYWARRDLRLHDNEALLRFARENSHGVILWCVDESFNRAGPFRRDFILGNLRLFKESVEARGGTILILNTSIDVALQTIKSRYSTNIRIYFTKDFTSEEITDEVSVERLVKDVYAFDSNLLIPEKNLPFPLSELPIVFTDYRKSVERSLQIPSTFPAPERLPAGFIDATTTLDLTVAVSHLIAPGEKAAMDRLQHYFWDSDSIRTYKETRNGMIHWDDSSKFSPWLSVGAISPRLIYQELRRYEQERVANDSTYWLFFELLWRDFFKLTARKFGDHLFRKCGFTSSKMTGTPRHPSQQAFKSWVEGKTEDEFVNANMLELAKTGWMSNRGRQNVASYLVHDLGVDWRRGASYFEEMLIDYDAAANWGNWAYIAGVGNDPRARKFDTHRQAEQYDPEGAYRLLWKNSKHE